MKLALALAVFLASFPTYGADTASYSPKIVLRTGMGLLSNVGTTGGSAATTGGFNLQYQHFLNSWLSVGAGYMAQFDLKNGGVPVSGLELLGRAYLWKQGTVSLHSADWGQTTYQSLWAPYISVLFGKRQFYLGPDYQSVDPVKQMSGEYSVLNVGIGIDYRLNRHLELNAEYTMSALAFSSTDSRVRIQENLLWMGLNYAF